MPQPLRLELAYTNKRPVALADLTNGLNSFASEYQRTLKRHATKFEDDKVRLYITEIRSGSIIAHLLPVMPTAMGVIVNANHVIEFCQHLEHSFEYLVGQARGLASRRPDLDEKSLKNLGALVEPVTKEDEAKLIFNGPARKDERTKVVITNGQAKELKKVIRHEIDRLNAPNTQVLDGVDLRWYQARNDRSNPAGDRAVIPAFFEKPVKVSFSDETIKRRMLLDHGNPFRLSYKVDVIGDFKGNRPKLYRIVRFHSAKDIGADGS